jgi:nicotinamidase-related amidase
MRIIIENRLTASAALSPANTAILAIHWQNDIVLPSGAFGPIFAESVRQTGALRNATRAVAESRRLGVTVIHVLAGYPEGYRGHVANNALFRTVLQRNGFVRGSPGWEPCDELRPEGDEAVVEHTRISAFYGTDLSAQLRAGGIVNLAITGVATNVAVDLTLRDAVQDGFNTYLLDDCCCSSTPAFHDAAMMTLAALSTHVMKHDHFLALLAGEASGASPS